MKKTFFWTSIAEKLLVCIITIGIVALTIVLFLYSDEVPVGSLIFISFVLLLCLAGCFIALRTRIVLDFNQKSISFYVIKKMTFNFQDIRAIEVEEINGVLRIRLKNGAMHEFPPYGLYSVLLKGRALRCTNEKVNLINRYLQGGI